MEKYTIDQLNGPARESAIVNVIEALNQLSGGRKRHTTAEDAYNLAKALQARFDANGNIDH